ncbi:metallophosphoesterase [Candidatus Saccharibacteria bacterium]|nr:metallophosphoesterase [Candidatus Saccharibacteria bacterium]
MRLVIDKYEAFTDKKIKKPLKIVLISDTHLAKNKMLFEKINLRSTLKGIEKIKSIDFFVLDGDYVNTAKDYLDNDTFNFFVDFIKKLAKIAPVIMVRGNHDLYFRTNRTDETYRQLQKLDNVTLLENEQIDFLGLRITAFLPPRESFHATKYGRHSMLISHEDFKKKHFVFNEEDFNLVLTHSPLSLSNKYMEEKSKDFFKKCDVVLSGHMHNGLIFSRNLEWIVKMLKNENSKNPFKKTTKRYADSGFWYVYKTFFLIRGCRGARYFGLNNNTVYLPSSKEYSPLKLYDHKNESVQIITKAVNKYAVIPFYVGRPSVVELKITPITPKN